MDILLLAVGLATLLTSFWAMLAALVAVRYVRQLAAGLQLLTTTLAAASTRAASAPPPGRERPEEPPAARGVLHL